MKRLSKPTSELDVAYDAIVIGSGYGGGAAARRGLLLLVIYSQENLAVGFIAVPNNGDEGDFAILTLAITGAPR